MTSDNTQCLAVGDCLTKHNLTDICDLMVLISVDNLWDYEYDSDLAIFPAFAVFPTSTSLKSDTVKRYNICLNFYIMRVFSIYSNRQEPLCTIKQVVIKLYYRDNQKNSGYIFNLSCWLIAEQMGAYWLTASTVMLWLRYTSADFD
jgi:hypothetical protein